MRDDTPGKYNPKILLQTPVEYRQSYNQKPTRVGMGLRISWCIFAGLETNLATKPSLQSACNHCVCVPAASDLGN
jgi:hypothetical protein